MVPGRALVEGFMQPQGGPVLGVKHLGENILSFAYRFLFCSAKTYFTALCARICVIRLSLPFYMGAVKNNAASDKKTTNADAPW